MKQHDVSSTQDVKKFRYVAPAKRETLPQQWSREFGSKSSNTKSSLHGLDLDSVWSIKKNVSVKPTPQFSTTLPGVNKKDTFQSGNSFYSRYKTSASHPAKQNQTISSENLNPGKASWLKSAPYPNSVTSASPMQNSDDDEFDFEMPSSTSQSTKWGKPQKIATQFTYTDSSTLGGASGPSLGKNSFGNFSRSSFQF
uniref:Uncharacterized LOC100187089 n=1 Tax=Ciona intestinalis TaxID=7719 RepID=H2XSJ1_CIOIN|nr:uncharacterized protein LOC100187089 [Ciona intestinalis]|eukprot:XP_002131829.1 uncharacterized protein LOC100187089 [Ciona intestinalis]